MCDGRIGEAPNRHGIVCEDAERPIDEKGGEPVYEAPGRYREGGLLDRLVGDAAHGANEAPEGEQIVWKTPLRTTEPGEGVAHLGSERQPEALGMLHGEVDVCYAQGPKSIAGIHAAGIGFRKHCVQLRQYVLRKRADEVRLAAKVVVGCRRTDTCPPGDVAQGEGPDPMFVENGGSLVQQRPPETAVMIRVDQVFSEALETLQC